jgi:3-oxoacyl-[acyl-carrier protein] reductase
MNFDYSGRTVLVTGAAHGFGRAIAGAFGVRGADVFVCDVVEHELAETVDIVGARCRGSVVDVTDARAVRTWVEGAARVTSRIDVVVNNAGGVLGQVGRPIEEVAVEDWQALLAVNQSATFWTSQAAAPHMKSAKRGRIVNISSGAGVNVSLTGIQAYASAKAGQIGLTRQLAHELGPFGITVNAIAPGFALTNESSRRQWDAYGREGQEALIQRIALRRLGTPADVAHAVLFLASEYASWITGVVLAVDGGK